MNARQGGAVLAVLCVSLLGAGVETAANAAAAFERLCALSGDWEATTAKGSTIRLSYRLLSAGSILVETFGVGGGRETLTIYHPDGPRLLATHYCAQGNQPRLKLQAADGNGPLVFRFLDATNLASDRDSHLTRLELAFTDTDHVTRTETYTSDGKEDSSTLKLTRVR